MSETTSNTRHTLELIDNIALAGVLVGVAFMGQPFSKTIFLLGFPVVLGCTLVHVVIDHLI
ncbi:hypothetical protein GF339_15500 [candidate division KSB3 bacterium]|uniref:Uncharacterized protein n=1 Tax=candidate division KSB3 bacterium TaxID=2044937 RepID=A0A9D5JX87_9BACT|nr:hypothetical protein [candidate division KSB3 bacterium]MBD3325989.1 hypothetical protein [candidate division KSB3 bacterium]